MLIDMSSGKLVKHLANADDTHRTKETPFI